MNLLLKGTAAEFLHSPKSNVSGATVMGVVGDSIARRPSVSSSFTAYTTLHT